MELKNNILVRNNGDLIVHSWEEEFVFRNKLTNIIVDVIATKGR